MTDTHTPGPWTHQEYKFIRSDEGGLDVATITGWGLLSQTNRANARLIAAAPDLLEALEELNAELDAYWNDHIQACLRMSEAYIQNITLAQLKCRDARDKARGES
jgi:hypothetical protein